MSCSLICYSMNKFSLADYGKATQDRSNLEGEYSWMWEYALAAHNGQMSSNPTDDCNVSLVKQYRHSMDRKITKAIMLYTLVNTPYIAKRNLVCTYTNTNHNKYQTTDSQNSSKTLH